jgi:hypothetical protein
MADLENAPEEQQYDTPPLNDFNFDDVVHEPAPVPPEVDELNLLFAAGFFYYYYFFWGYTFLIEPYTLQQKKKMKTTQTS